MTRRAVFLDRDGTLNELVPDPHTGNPESPLRPQDVRLVPGAASAVRSLAEAGWMLVGVSNQPAAAKGATSVAALHSVQERVVELLAAEGALVDDFRLCLHHPEGSVAELTLDCQCRKPRPGMLLEAASEHGIALAESWMVGDTDADVLAGHAAGCRAALIDNPGSAHKRTGAASPDLIVATLSEAAAEILRVGQSLPWPNAR